MEITRGPDRKASLAINQTMLLVLAIIMLALLAAFYLLLGDKAEAMISSALNFPIGAGDAA